MDLTKKKIELEMSFEDFLKKQYSKKIKSLMLGLIIGAFIIAPGIYGVACATSAVMNVLEKTQ
jgi:hypothetical protein